MKIWLNIQLISNYIWTTGGGEYRIRYWRRAMLLACGFHCCVRDGCPTYHVRHDHVQVDVIWRQNGCWRHKYLWCKFDLSKCNSTAVCEIDMETGEDSVIIRPVLRLLEYTKTSHAIITDKRTLSEARSHLTHFAFHSRMILVFWSSRESSQLWFWQTSFAYLLRFRHFLTLTIRQCNI